MATLVPKCPTRGHKPANLLKQLQSRTSVNVEQVLSSNTLVLDGPALRNWQAVLQIHWQILAKDFLGSSRCIPIENPGGVASDRVQFPEDGGSGGESPSLAIMPEEPAGRGGRYSAFPIEDPGGAGGDRVPTGLALSGQDDDSEELARLQREFEAVPSYVERIADGREVWQ